MQTIDSQTQKSMKEKVDILANAAKQAGTLTINNILCELLHEFEHDVLSKVHNKENKCLASQTCNIFLDYILDQLSALGICSPATDDMTAHECENMQKILNQTDDYDDTDNTASDSEE